MNDPHAALTDSTKTLLVLPLDTIAINYVDKNHLSTDSLRPNSYYVDAANSLLAFEAVKHFLPCTSLTKERAESLAIKFKNFNYSRLAPDSTVDSTVLPAIKSALANTNADFILIPYACQLKYNIYQPQGWRSGGPSYQRPVTFRAYGLTHIQIWNKNGELLLEKISSAYAGRPIMYGLFSKRKKETDITKLAKSFYAPPLVRALNLSIQQALLLKQQNHE